MRARLVALNAQYFHTALGVRSIYAWCREKGLPGVDLAFCELTINQHFDDLLRAVAGQDAGVYLFSCYIWNIELVRALATELRKLYPATVLLAGGPQVEHCAEEFLEQNPAFDAVLCGEGEPVCHGVLSALGAGRPWQTLPGVATRGTPAAPSPVPDMDALAFPYPGGEGLTGRIIYYETMRGCPFGCSYCLSAAGQGVRLKSLTKVYEELERLLAMTPRQVKFVDRTFNCRAGHALAAWQFLAARDNGITNFHFELAGELVTREMLEFLGGVRPGLFQFEIGVQSCNPQTLEAIRRPCDLGQLFELVAALQKPANIHLHLDLIAGLPYEDYAGFCKSFDRVYAARPHQLQLGFLKVLPGSPLAAEAQRYGLLHTSRAPFEVLRTRWLEYGQLVRLKDMAAMVELYYNSGRFACTVAALCGRFASPAAFYEALAQNYREGGHFDAPLSKLGQYEFLGAFAAQNGGIYEALQWLCRLDMASHEKPRRLPGWVKVDGSLPVRERALRFYAEEENRRRYLPGHEATEPKQLLRAAHIECFPFDPHTRAPCETALLFDYTRRDITGKALVQQITLPG